MFVLTRQPNNSRLETEAVKRWPWITCFYFSDENKDSVMWSGKMSAAKIFRTNTEADEYRGTISTKYHLRKCRIENISVKELFEARLKGR